MLSQSPHSVRSFSGTASATADMSMCYRTTCYIYTTHQCEAPMISCFPEATQSIIWRCYIGIASCVIPHEIIIRRAHPVYLGWGLDALNRFQFLPWGDSLRWRRPGEKQSLRMIFSTNSPIFYIPEWVSRCTLSCIKWAYQVVFVIPYTYVWQ